MDNTTSGNMSIQRGHIIAFVSLLYPNISFKTK